MPKGNRPESYVVHLKATLDKGSYRHGSHAYRLIEGAGGSYLLFYVQGMLMSLWHRESGLVEHMPIVWPQDENTYRPLQKKFVNAVNAMKGGTP